MLINPYRFAGAYDTDAQAYITAVETADGQALETDVKDAINAFVVGCKADGIWSAIKASCILAGARTLAGALVPLVGTAPTNNNFVAGDYNRKTGLLGNGSSKYINSNTYHSAAPQNSFHLSVYASSSGTSGANQVYIGGRPDSTCSNDIYLSASLTGVFGRNRCTAVTPPFSSLSTATGFIGHSRALSSNFAGRASTYNTIYTASSVSLGSSVSLTVFAQNTASSISQHTTARLAFYSIGESLDLALLDTRVTTLINALAAAIP